MNKYDMLWEIQDSKDFDSFKKVSKSKFNKSITACKAWELTLLYSLRDSIKELADSIWDTIEPTIKRIEELEIDIQTYLTENYMDELYITRPEPWDDTGIWLTNLMNITSELSIIIIESIEDVSDTWGQITHYKKVEDSNMWYTIILNNSAEKLNIQSVSDLAEVIYDYEMLASKLTLTINNG